MPPGVFKKHKSADISTRIDSGRVCICVSKEMIGFHLSSAMLVIDVVCVAMATPQRNGHISQKNLLLGHLLFLPLLFVIIIYFDIISLSFFIIINNIDF